MQDPDRARRDGRVRRTVAAVLGTLLLVTAAACSGDSSDDAEPEAPAASKGETATIEERPAPAQVRVTLVSGRLRPKDRATLERRVGRVVTAYFRDAHLGGDYPRSSFRSSFGTFTSGAQKQARGDLDLLTNSRLGPTTESVLARKQAVFLSVLAPGRVAAGVSARVDLRYRVERGERADQVVQVSGRLLLTRTRGNDWKIFGYDLARSARPAGKDA